MTDNTIRKSIYVKATRGQVWPHLTEEALINVWFHQLSAPFEKGQRFEFVDGDGDRMIWGNMREITENERLEYTFTMEQMDGEKSKVIWTLKDVEGGTRISLVHSNLPRAARNFDLVVQLDTGWDEHLLALRDALA